MTSAPEYPKYYLYQRIVHAILYIDENYAADIDLNNISDEAAFSKFHFIRLEFMKSRRRNFMELKRCLKMTRVTGLCSDKKDNYNQGPHF